MSELRWLAHFELAVAAIVILYVFILYLKNFKAFFAIH